MATPSSTSLSTTNAATPDSRGSVVAIQVTGTWTGTITFQSTLDGSTYVTTGVVPISGGAVVTTTTGNGIWRVNASGLAGVRAVLTTASSGTAVVLVVGYDEGQVFAT